MVPRRGPPTSAAAWPAIPTHMLAVRFRLQDLGYAPGQTRLIGFCASNQLVVAGGPFTNKVVVYPDQDGLPDTGVVLAQGTISTGDGNGDSVVDLARPVTLTGDFWLVVRGAAATSGERFNVEYDAGPNSGASFSSATGVAGLTTANDPGGHPGGVNYALRAHLESITPGAFSYVTGGIARLQGALGTNWRSKLALLNRSGGPASVTLSYVRDTAITAATTALANGELRSWDDVVTELFGVSGEVLRGGEGGLRPAARRHRPHLQPPPRGHRGPVPARPQGFRHGGRR